MNRALISALIVFFCLPLSLAASVTVKKVGLFKDSGGNPGAATKSFSSRDNPFHVVVTMKPTDGSATITATLIAVEAAKTHDYKVASVDLGVVKGADEAKFKFSLPRPWPEGRYRVEIRVDGKTVRSLDFNIKG